MGTFRIKCPKCGIEHVYTVSEDDINDARTYSIVRLGFIHSDHVLILDIDSNGIVRGAYINTFRNIIPGIKFIYDDYRIITYPIIRSETQLVIFYLDRKLVDMRAGIKLVSLTPHIMRRTLNLVKRIGKYSWYRGEISISNTKLDIAYGNSIVILLKSMLNWQQKTQILKRILEIITQRGFLKHEQLIKIMNKLDQIQKNDCIILGGFF